MSEFINEDLLSRIEEPCCPSCGARIPLLGEVMAMLELTRAELAANQSAIAELEAQTCNLVEVAARADPDQVRELVDGLLRVRDFKTLKLIGPAAARGLGPGLEPRVEGS